MTLAVVLPKIPVSLVAGNSVSWEWGDSRFPASAWTLVYSLVMDGKQIKWTATASGDTHVVEILSTASASYTAGDYSFQAHVAKAATSERYLVDSGIVRILPNFESATTGYDARSWAKKTLDAIEAVITGKVAHDRASYSIQGRSLASYTWAEVLDLHHQFKSRYRAETRMKRRLSRGSYKVRFGG